MLTLAVGCHQAAPDTAPKSPDPVPVTVGAVGERTVRRVIPVTGTLHGFEDVTLSPKVDGRILSAPYDIGDTAVPGAVLLQLDPTDYEKQVAWERRSLTAELARLGLSELPAGTFDVEAVPEVQRAEAARVNARRANERVRGLSSATKVELDAADTELKVSEANKRAAVTQAQATLAAARARGESLAMAEQKLRDCQLRVPEPQAFAAWGAVVGPAASPVRYAVAAKMVSEGEMTRSFPGTNAYRLVIAHTLKLKATVPEKHTPDVQLGQPVDVKVEAFGGATFPGTVSRINPTIDPTTRTFQVEVTVPNGHGKLKPGGFARADIVVGTAQALTIPPAALVVFAGVSKVFVTDNGVATAVPVTVGDRGPDWVEVTGDLKAGQRVVTSGFIPLYNGAAISIRR